MSYQNNELYHYGVKGMKWGIRKKRDKSSFNTTHRDTGLDKSGKIAYTSGYTPGHNKGVTKRQDRKAQRAALREGRAYRKVAGSKGNKDLSVIGNKYASEIDKARAKNQAKNQAKDKMKNKVKSSVNETKRVLNDYKRNPILAYRDAARMYMMYDVSKFIAGPALKKGKKAADRALQRYYDKHPEIIY